MKHLTQDDRYQINEQITIYCKQKDIARQLGVSPSTISRQCHRNRCGDSVYRA